MVLLSCQALEKSYASRPLFKGLTLGVFEGDRIGIIGANGSGKSTLLKILAGLETPDGGEIVRRRFLKVAYVGQQAHFSPQLSVYDALKEAALAAGVAAAEIETAVSRQLSKLGFADFEQKVQTLSGGWLKRLAIGAGLVQSPDVLLLDEPTNHLDLESILWLEKLLKEATFTWVMVSHDRYLLEQSVRKIVEIGTAYEGGLLLGEGRYSDFIQKRSEYFAQQSALAETLANKARREIEWLRQGAKARTTKAKYRVEEAHAIQEELAKVQARLKTTSAGIDFSASQRKTRKLIAAEGVTLSRGGKALFRNLSLTLSPGMRLGLLGPNGSGKSSLMKALIGEIEVEDGVILRADQLKTVYFDQARASLDRSKPLRRALAEEGDAVIYRDRSVHVTSWAKRFQFRPEQLDVPVRDLSGGEQARVLIARMMLEAADVLMLDEPTNDLDIPILEVLEESLEDFPGALVLVSHDRFLMNRLCNVFVGLDGKGGSEVYADYFQWQDALQRDERAAAKTKAGSIPVKEARPSSSKRLSYMEQREYDGMEAAILAAEERLAEAQAQVEDPAIASQAAKLVEATKTLESAQSKVEALYARWSELEAKTKGEGL